MSSIKKINQNMFISVSMVGLGLTEAIIRIQAYTCVRVRAAIGKVHILYSKMGIDQMPNFKTLSRRNEIFIIKVTVGFLL